MFRTAPRTPGSRIPHTGSRYRPYSLHAPRSQKTRTPISRGEALHTNFAGCTRRVHEFVSANHNPHVSRELSDAVVDRVEEDEIAGAEIAWVHFDPRLKLFGHRARHSHPVLIEHIPHEPAAIEPGWIAAPVSVRDASK